MKKYEIISLIVAAIIIAATFVVAIYTVEQEEIIVKKDHLTCVIELGEHPERKKNLIIGFNYDLLKEYAAYNAQTVDISLSSGDAACLDSLKQSKIDILVLPFHKHLSYDSILVSYPIDSATVWLMPAGERAQMSNLNAWIRDLHQDKLAFEQLREPYMHRFDVFRSRRRSVISPYDSLIRNAADSMSWDWRMLAAVIYKESRFHIEARSRRGARGLMQMMPKTANRYSVDDLLEPSSNIMAGSSLLGDLSRRYRPFAYDKTEVFKYTLAAYNAGVGRIEDMLRLAEHQGINPAYWDSVKLVIPQMSGEKIDTTLVRCGPFKGVETLDYVDSVFEIYNRLREICP